MPRFRKKQQPLSNDRALYAEIDAFLKSEDVVSLYMDFSLNDKRYGLLKVSFGVDSAPEKNKEFSSLLEQIGIERKEINDFFKVLNSKENYFFKDLHGNFSINFNAYESLRKFISLPEFFGKKTMVNKLLSSLASNLNWNIENGKVKAQYSDGFLKFEHSGRFPLDEKLNDLGVFNVGDFDKPVNELIFKHNLEIINSKPLYSHAFNDEGGSETKLLTQDIVFDLLKNGLAKSLFFNKFEGYEEFGKDFGKVFTKIIVQSIPKPTVEEESRYLSNL
jgi:hypothetical protein